MSGKMISLDSTMLLGSLTLAISGLVWLFKLRTDLLITNERLKSMSDKIDQTSRGDDNDLRELEKKLDSTRRILFQLVDFINADNNSQSKPIFRIGKYD